MARLEELKNGALVRGIIPSGPVVVIDAKWHGNAVIELTYKDSSGQLGSELIYRDREKELELVEAGPAWRFDGDGALFRLVSEAYRIRLAHIFDPFLAIHTSVVEPLPHQITAVYEEMLPRQPLRFLLADDPGAGKTIMAGLLIKELMMREDVKRCLICCPGSLVEQWQDELWQKFHLDFKIISNQTIEDSKSGNPYQEMNLVISRLDHMSRNEEIQAKLKQTDWDLVIVDEAHKMAAHYYGNEIKETKRYKLGKLLGALDRTRHFLLMTATPHNGKEPDFQLFMALLDQDRFEGKYREGVHSTDASNLMRRMVKEQLLKFDGTPLFPERRAYVVSYELSEEETELYEAVTRYVGEEMNRVERLEAEGQKGRGSRVGLALTTLQRRLASSPEAIYQSLRRRRERLEKRVTEEREGPRSDRDEIAETARLRRLSEDDMEDLEEFPEDEIERTEDLVVEEASAARTITELLVEIESLKELEAKAFRLRQLRTDRKWEELSQLLQGQAEMFDEKRGRRKIIIFTEHRDTLMYIEDRIRSLLGRNEAVVTIHGQVGREERRKRQQQFTQDKDVLVLVATDAAGEGVNLQRAHLMVNYDLPWNPNRLEQRFGRIHRIGQTEVCHMWNLVASRTREGDVYRTLLDKLENERRALGSGVFDVLGQVFQETPLRKLLIDAIRYGDRPEVKARLHQRIEGEINTEHLRALLEERALADDALDAKEIRRIQEDMERAEARRLQPHFIRSLFIEAFKRLGGTAREREKGRYEVSHVPTVIRAREAHFGRPILNKYERITFEKPLIYAEGKPLAEYVCPGHPLLDATIDVILERHRELLKSGAVLVDPTDMSQKPRILFYVEHAILDGRTDRNGRRRVVSKQLEFVEVDEDFHYLRAGYAPYLDYCWPNEEEKRRLSSVLESEWLSKDIESSVIAHCAQETIPEHLDLERCRREGLISKSAAAIRDRLTKEINYWDYRANELKNQELAGKPNDRLNSGKARQRADELQARLHRRMAELDLERRLSPTPPVVIGGVLVVPQGLLLAMGDTEQGTDRDLSVHETKEVEALAMQKVMETERALGRIPRDVSQDKAGYDVESSIPDTGRLLFIEVKGRVQGAAVVTITKNEILTALNKPEDFILAIVLVEPEGAIEPVYVRQPFAKEPDFGVTSVNYKLKELMAKGERPA